MTRPRFDLTAYLVTDRALCGARSVEDVVRRAILGGVTLVQLRDPHAKTGELVEQARALLRLLRPVGIPLIINDRVDVALAVDADGVHVGQADMAVSDARRLLGPKRILGWSVTHREQLSRALPTELDYLGVGPIFATQTKPDAAAPIGAAGLAEIAASTSLPIVAIGGLNAQNAAQALEAGAAGVAVVSAICAADDPERATRELVSQLHQAQRVGRTPAHNARNP